jgi:hypothetical protein
VGNTDAVAAVAAAVDDDVDDVDDNDDDDDDVVGTCSLVGEDVSVAVVERSIGFINRSD